MANYRGSGKTQDVKIAGVSLDLAAAVTAKSHVLLGGILVAGAAGASFKFQSGASTDLTGTMLLAANGVCVLPTVPDGYLNSAAGEKLNLVVSAGALNGVVTVQTIT